jgi:hypothetical protein
MTSILNNGRFGQISIPNRRSFRYEIFSYRITHGSCRGSFDISILLVNTYSAAGQKGSTTFIE